MTEAAVTLTAGILAVALLWVLAYTVIVIEQAEEEEQ